MLGLHSYLKNKVQFIDRALQKKKMEATKVKVLYQEKFQRYKTKKSFRSAIWTIQTLNKKKFPQF